MTFLHLLSNLDSEIAGFIAVHGSLIYALLFLIIFFEIGIFPLFFLPGNPLIFITGSFCKLGSLNIIYTLITLITAAILGNLLSYNLGKLFSFKIQNSQSRWINQNALLRTHHFYAKYGLATLIASPFIAVIRTFAPLLAGVSGMPVKRYLFASSVGSLLWILGLGCAGYFFSSLPFIRQHMASIVLAGLAVGVCFILYGIFKAKAAKVKH